MRGKGFAVEGTDLGIGNPRLNPWTPRAQGEHRVGGRGAAGTCPERVCAGHLHVQRQSASRRWVQGSAKSETTR